MRRGFKSHAERLAVEQRGEMGYSVMAALDPRELAEYLAIPVLTFSECAASAKLGGSFSLALRQLREHVSAITIFDGYRRVIVHNHQNAPTRQAADLTHEIAHALLEHEPVELNDPQYYPERRNEQEDEADFLAGALLIPRDGALQLIRDGISEQAVAEHYGVSFVLARWRIRGTGIYRQLDNTRKRRSI